MTLKKGIPIFIFISLVILSLSIGAGNQFSWSALVGGDPVAVRVFFESRLPRTLAICLASSSLSLSGLLMQTMTQNPYAAPSTAGTVEAAQLGMLLSLLFFPQATLLQKMVFAFGTSMLATVLFVRMLRHIKLKEKWQLPLLGMIFGGMLASLAQVLAYRFNLVQSMTSWSQGSFTFIQTHQYEWLFLNLLVLAGIIYFAEGFSLMALGEETSLLLGLPYSVMEGLGLFLVSLSTATTMITVGGLPFIGVIIPNLVRTYRGDHLKHSAGLVACSGTILVMACDIVGRLVIRPYEVSVSLILGMVGAILFISILWKGEQHEKTP